MQSKEKENNTNLVLIWGNRKLSVIAKVGQSKSRVNFEREVFSSCMQISAMKHFLLVLVAS